MSYQLVYDALVLLVERQPMLRAVINTIENGEKYFVIKDISEVIKMMNITKSDVKASTWKDVWFEYTRKERENGLLWRVLILQEEFLPGTKGYVNTLMFNFNHSCIDGVSCVKLCKQFLHKINELANNAIDVNDEIPSLELLPYSHDIVTHKRPLYSILNFLLSCCGVQSLFRFLMKRMIFKVTPHDGSSFYKTAHRALNSYHREMVIRLSSCNFILSFGSFSFLQNHQEKYRLHECFINNLNHGLAETFAHYNHTINGKMTWEITYNASKIQSHHAEKFVNLCFTRFINIAYGV